MYLQEVFDQLSSGELSQTNLGTITEDSWPRVVMHINLGLTDLFKRFFLREGRVALAFVSGETAYQISGSSVLKIEKVLTDADVELALNDSEDPWALTTTDTAPVTLTIPEDIVEQAVDLPEKLVTAGLTVVYRARHPKIDYTTPTFDPETYPLLLPDTHLQALLYFVASRVLSPMGMGQTEGVTGTNYWRRYEAECARLLGDGTQLDRNTGFDKLRNRGFV